MYPFSMSSLERVLHGIETEESKLVEVLVANVKYKQFTQLIQPMENVQAFEKLGVTVQYEAIAQHYGFKTFLMDITSDFEVALFFACCKYRDGQWEPLTSVDTEVMEEKKFGVIFRRAVMPWSMWPEDEHPIFPIGYQPFMRCSNQTGYTLAMGENEDLKTMDLPGMEMLRFHHNTELAQRIYDKMDGGNKIYAKEDVLAIIRDKLDTFIKSKVIDEEALNEMVQSDGEYSEHSIAEWKKLLVSHGYIVGSNPLTITTDEEAQITKKLAGFDIQDFYGIKIHYRPCYYSR